MDTAVTYEVASGEWITLQAFSYADVTVPKGFHCDLSSIPRCLWFLIAPFELSINAPLVHDFLYSHGGNGHTRKQCDQLFLQIMRAEGVTRWRRIAAYLAVRLFGALAFKK